MKSRIQWVTQSSQQYKFHCVDSFIAGGESQNRDAKLENFLGTLPDILD